MDNELIQVKMCVAGQGYDGPDLWFCIVAATQDEIDCGDHYVAAKNYIANTYGIKAEFACEENDSCAAIMSLFVWDSLKQESPISIFKWKNP